MFDGVCNLCNGAVRFIAANDPHGHFAFAPLLDGTAESIVLLQDGRRFQRSDAALRIAAGLRAPWPLAFLLILVPRAWRDAAYDAIARNRYRWFGRREACALPDAGLRDRFLVQPPE